MPVFLTADPRSESPQSGSRNRGTPLWLGRKPALETPGAQREPGQDQEDGKGAAGEEDVVVISSLQKQGSACPA